MNVDQIIKMSALRWLNSICLVDGHDYEGVADRDYWAWKTKDFANGTWQGGISGFLDSLDLFDFKDLEVKNILTKCVEGTLKIQRSNGSFEEAYPFESSYAVSGLVLFNLLYSYFRYPQFFEESSLKELKRVTEKTYAFLVDCCENHGTISNHVITTELSILLAEKFLNISSNPNRFNRRLKDLTIEPGIFREYEGADPGYQSLLNHYWTAASLILTKDDILYSEILNSYQFIFDFILPSNKFANLVGSRGSSIVYPSGLMESQQLSDWFVDYHFKTNSCINPLIVDSGNFVPVFNSWALFRKNKETQKWIELESRTQVRNIESIGLKFRHYNYSSLIWNERSSVFEGVRLVNNIWVDQSFYGINEGKKCSQQLPLEIKYGVYKLRLHSVSIPDYNWYKAIALRIIAVSIYRFPVLQRALKKIMKKMLMDSHLRSKETTFTVKIEDTGENIVLFHNAQKLAKPYFYRHMASANYFKEDRE